MACECPPDSRSPLPAAVKAACGLSEAPPNAWGASVGGWHGGQWLIPEVQNDTTGLVCPADNPDVAYIAAALDALEAHGSIDTSRVFFTGCSMGGAMTGWISQCFKQRLPSAVTAFATQSTGLKVKGDGLTFPPDNYQTDGTTWGECSLCRYFPAPVVPTSGLKACVVDQSGDPNFYQSSLALHSAWAAAGMATNLSISAGGHCQTHSFTWIANCLDDGSGRLLGAQPQASSPLVTRRAA